MIKKMVLVLVLAWVGFVLSGCTAINGLGEDIKRLTSPYVQK